MDDSVVEVVSSQGVDEDMGDRVGPTRGVLEVIAPGGGMGVEDPKWRAWIPAGALTCHAYYREHEGTEEDVRQY